MDSNAPTGLFGVGAVFIDDIVRPDGQTYMNRLGGGVVHAMMGAALWDERPGLLAYAGADLDPKHIDALNQALDTRGLILQVYPQIRAWQIFEHDGARRELYRTEPTAPFIAGAQSGDMIIDYEKCAGAYILADSDGIRDWSARLPGHRLLWEPNANFMRPENADAFRRALRTCNIDIISPNIAEARQVYGDLDAVKIVRNLLEDGAQCAALRMGDRGSLAANQESDGVIVVGVAEAREVIDETGAGNAYCGGFLAGRIRGLSLREAGAMGAASASFAIETIGALVPARVDRAERDRRYERLLTNNPEPMP